MGLLKIDLCGDMSVGVVCVGSASVSSGFLLVTSVFLGVVGGGGGLCTVIFFPGYLNSRYSVVLVLLEWVFWFHSHGC